MQSSLWLFLSEWRNHQFPEIPIFRFTIIKFVVTFPQNTETKMRFGCEKAELVSVFGGRVTKKLHNCGFRNGKFWKLVISPFRQK
jgi:hypothetical protein